MDQLITAMLTGRTSGVIVSSSGSGSGSGSAAASTALVNNFTRCPGLHTKTGKWWVPHGRLAQNVTYCDYCKRTLGITGCYEYDHGTRNACNCDSYTLKRNVTKALFTVSLWNRSLDTHYESEPGTENVVKMPSNTNFAFLINSELPKDQIFAAEITCGGKPVEIKSLHGRTGLSFQYSVLVKGFTTDDDDKKFLFVDRGTLSDEDWELIKPLGSDEIVIKIHVLKQVPADYSNIMKSSIGAYKFEDGSYRVTHMPGSTSLVPKLKFVTGRYNNDIANTPLDASLSFKDHYEQVTVDPIVIRIKLELKGSAADADKANNVIVAKARKENMFAVREKITRIEKMKQSLAEIIKTQQDTLAKYDEDLLEATTQMSLHLEEPVAPEPSVKQKKKLTKIERKMFRERTALEIMRDATGGDLVDTDGESDESFE